MNGGHVVVLVAAGSDEAARALARGAVEARLAACAQVLPVRSCYVWEGAVEEADEHLVLLKTRRDLYEALEAHVVARHDYDVPEIVALPVAAGLPGYLAWIDRVVADRS